MQQGEQCHRKQLHYKPPVLISCCLKQVAVTAVIEVYKKKGKQKDPFLSSGFFFHLFHTDEKHELTDKISDTLKIFMMTFVTFL